MAPTRVQTAPGDASKTVIALFDSDTPGPSPPKGGCREHGSHERLGVANNEVRIEKEGFDWVLDDRVVSLSYCVDCLVDSYGQNRYFEDPEPLDLVKLAVESKWREVRGSFSPVLFEEAGEVSHCPFCGDSLAKPGRHPERGGVMGTCEIHGDLAMKIRQVDR